MGVLGNAHAPEDDRRIGLGIFAGNGADDAGIDAAHLLHRLRRERRDMRLEPLEPFGMRLDVLHVVEPLGDDHIHHRIKQSDVAAIPELQHVRGVAIERGAARVHHDELRPAFRRLLEIGCGNRVVLGRIGADHDDHVGILDRREGCGHRARADGLHERCHRGGMAQPRAVIDIVRSESDPHQLLEEIGLLVGTFGRAKTGQCLAAVALADGPKALRRRNPAPPPSSPRGNG